MRFEFASAGRILFGPGAVRDLGGIAVGVGTKALVVTGRDSERCAPAIEALRNLGLQSTLFAVAGEPDFTHIEQGVLRARATACDFVVGVGGGSAIDAGKAIAAMLTNPGELLDYIEVVGRGKSIVCPPAPYIAIPTTAGTGSEVTRNAVLAAPEQRVKVSLRSPLMLPRVALIDPELTVSLTPAVTASTGVDTLTQLIEPYVCSRANPMTDAFCIEGIRNVAGFLRVAFRNGCDLEARTMMSLASLLGGLSLANAGLGVVHGFAAPVGGVFPAPHGAVCAAILPHGMRSNIAALRDRAPQSPALRRYQQIARILTGRNDAAPEEGALWVEELIRELAIPPLSAYGVTERHIPALVEKALNASSMKPNPITLTTEELARVLKAAL